MAKPIEFYMVGDFLRVSPECEWNRGGIVQVKRFQDEPISNSFVARIVKAGPGLEHVDYNGWSDGDGEKCFYYSRCSDVQLCTAEGELLDEG